MPTAAKTEADELREPQRRDGFALGGRGEPRRDDGAKIRPYGLRRGPVAAPSAKTTACSASRPAATSENVDSDQHGDEDGGGDPGGEPGAADVDLLGSYGACRMS